MIKLIITFGVLTPIIYSPPLIGLTLIITTLFVTLTLILWYSTWVAIIIFIIYVGGLIIIFAYFISIRPNLPLTTPTGVRLVITIIYFSTFTYIYPRKTYSSPSTQFSEIISSQFTPSIVILLYILFRILIIIVYITKTTGRLRSFK